MPLLGKIVVIKRNGTDGTEFPLTASCLFGRSVVMKLQADVLFSRFRKLDCDIRIQLPQVSKEHCRIELNENKELILTNLSSVNPTRINGQVLQQSERLKDGDLITIIDRSFRFEYPPPPTPKKKRLSTSEKGEAVKVLQDQKVRSTPGSANKKKSEVSDTCLKDGSNLPSSQDPISEVTKGDGKQTDNTLSPFTELYHMVKRDLASKSPWKAAAHPKSPLARPQVDRNEPKKDENAKPATPKSEKKKRRSSNAKAVDSSDSLNEPTESSVAANPVENLSEEQAATPAVQETPGKQKRRSSGPVTSSSEASATPVSQKQTPRATPQKFSAGEVAQQILSMDSSAEKTPKSPKRRSGGAQPQSPAVTPKSQATVSPGPKTPVQSQTPTRELEESSTEAQQTPRTSPRANAGKRFQVQEAVQEAVTTPGSHGKDKGQVSTKKQKRDDLPVPMPKRKRVSFGGQLSPELFDKRLPPNSPLRRGATPGRRSLGFSQTPLSLLRRASTIGLMGFRLNEAVPESPSKNASPRRTSSSAKSPKASPAKSPKASPAKSPKASPAKSPKASPAKSPKASPAKKSPSTKAKTPSPRKNKTSPKTATPSPRPATPKTPKSAKRVSNASFKTPSPSESMILTPTVQGRFSVTRITTPSPDRAGRAKVDVSQECVTPKISVRRSSMKASARKTPKSALKIAFEVMRSRRSGASRANLKVVRSWADIVKFGQVKPQMECVPKKTATKQTVPKQTKTAKPKTPARKLKDVCSTGHADSPATIVVGKACLRAAQAVGAAPKIVTNVALFKKDMKMDEDLSGIADIFKTPANRKKKTVVDNDGEYSKTPLGVHSSSLTEMSVMNTPEESGEMLVSPLNVASTAKLGRYNSEAVTRLLQDDQDVSLIGSNDFPASEAISELQMSADDQMEEPEPQIIVKTPQRKPEPSECLTGVKKLMRTPKQKSEPIEDLRGKLLKTPKAPKPTQEENFEGVKELLNTPKQKGIPVENMAGLKKLMKTPKESSSPVVCAVALKKLMKTPKAKTGQEEDLTGLKQLMQTPKLKGEPVEHSFGVKRLMKTPKQKSKPVEEDLTGIQEMMKTPKQKSKPVEEDLGEIQEKIKTPKQQGKPVEEDLTGIQEKIKTPKQQAKPVEEDLAEIQEKIKTPKQQGKAGTQQMKTPKEKSMPAEDLTGIKQMMKTPKAKSKSVEEDLTGIKQMMKTPKQRSEPVEDLTGMKRLLRTPKVKGQAVEKNFGISRLVKTPKQKGGEVVEDFTGLAELVCEPTSESTSDVAETTQNDMSESVEVQEPLASNAVAVEDEESEDKENICPVEVAEPIPQEEEGGLVKATNEELLVQESVSETLSRTVDATPKKEEKAEMSSSVKKTPRGGRMRTGQKSPSVDSASSAVVELLEEDIVEETLPTMKGKRGKTVEEPVSMSSPVRKSARLPKGQVEDKEVNQTTPAPKTSEDVEQDSECPSVAVKPRRGKKADQTAESVLAEDAVAGLEATEPSAEVEVSVKSPTPAPKARRGRKGKQETEVPPAIPASEEPEKEDLAPESELPSSSEIKTNTRTRRGKQTKKENLKAVQVEEPADLTPANGEPDGAVVVADELPQMPVEKPGRGRRAKPGALKDLQVVDEPKADVEPVVVESAPPAVRSARGAKSRQQKPEVTEDVDEQPATADTKAAVTETEGTVVKNVRGGRRTKQTKAAELSEDAHEEPEVDHDAAKQSVTPVTKPTRGKRTGVVRDESEGPVKRGRRAAATAEVPPPVVRPSRGKKAAVVAEREDVPEDATAVEEPVKDNSKVGTPPESQPEEAPVLQASSEASVCDSVDVSEVPAKRGRGRYAKAVSKAEEPVAEETKRSTSKKAVNWNSDLVAWKNIEKPPAAEEEPQQKSSRRKAEPAAKASTKDPSGSETKQSADAPTKGRRGRAAKKQDEPLMEKLEVAAEEEPQQQTSIKKAEPEAKDSVSEAKQSVDPPAKGRRGRATRKQNEMPAEEEPPQQTSTKKAEDSDTPVSQSKPSAEPPAKGRRGRVAKKQDEPLVEKNTAAEEEPQQQESTKKAEDTLVSKQSVETPAKGRRGRVAKKQDEPLVEKLNTAAEEEPQQQESTKKAEDTLVSKQPVDPPAKGRKGRVAKKQDEPEKSEMAAEEKAPVVRRGRAGASLVSKTDEVAACPRKGGKRKATEAVADETETVESLPKRQKGKAASAEPETEASVPSRGRRAAGKETPEVASEQSESNAKTDESKPVRGKRKAAQEDSVPTQSEDPVS
ncbi:hypothetical protein NFI96_016631, partial [Prochilodus magdalenae]